MCHFAEHYSIHRLSNRPQAAENSPYLPKLYLPPKIRRKKYGLVGYQPNYDKELAAGKIPAKIRLIVKNCLKYLLYCLHFRGIPTTKCHFSIGFYFLIAFSFSEIPLLTYYLGLYPCSSVQAGPSTSVCFGVFSACYMFSTAGLVANSKRCRPIAYQLSACTE